LLLLLLLGSTSGRALSIPNSASLLSCLSTALEAHRAHPEEENSILDKRSSLEEAEEDEDEEVTEEELGKRTFPGDEHSKFPSPAKGRSSASRAKGERRTKVTLSLDVPTNIMNILFNIAKAKNLRAKAAANAHLMAQIGRRK
ncbi:UCN3 protein, partial [Cisticola juncidis]|nr:UCN3 protein [Cisticola juncidis]